jgi:hypothetical protein
MYHPLMIIFVKDLDIFEVFNKIKEFKALIENLSERKIKILRSDNGGEYTSKEFVSFCRDVGIKRELTTGLQELKGDHEGICDGCAQGKNIKNPFPKRDNKAEGVLELLH